MQSSDDVLCGLDIIFYALHIIIIAFNLFAWMWKKTLRLHLVVAGLTVFSWLVLGIWYGFGYCFLTDWHWQVKRRLGETDLPDSFVTYFFKSIGTPISPDTADILTLLTFGIAVGASVYRNVKMTRERKRDMH